MWLAGIADHLCPKGVDHEVPPQLALGSFEFVFQGPLTDVHLFLVQFTFDIFANPAQLAHMLKWIDGPRRFALYLCTEPQLFDDL